MIITFSGEKTKFNDVQRVIKFCLVSSVVCVLSIYALPFPISFPSPPQLVTVDRCPFRAWFCRTFLPVKREFSLPANTWCLLRGSLHCWSFPQNGVGPSSCSLKQLEATVVLIWNHAYKAKLTKLN